MKMDSESDTDSIATTTLHGLLDIDEYFIELSHKHNESSIWQTFVRMNQDVFYPWVEFLPPQLVAIKGIRFITEAIRFQFNGSIVKRRTIDKIIRRLYPEEIPGDSAYFHVVKKCRFDKRLYFISPVLKNLVTRAYRKDVHDVWYEMNLSNRNWIRRFLLSIGVTWVEEHLC